MRLQQSFFENKTTLELAKDLIGKVLVVKTKEGTIKGIINETEAYTEEDESCHAFGGNRTKRNEVMFWDAGHLYVYFTYGMYHCCNIVTGEKDCAEAVLIRSIIPIEGIEIIKKNRNWTKNTLKGLIDGPGKLCQGLNLNKLYNGINLLENLEIYIEDLGYFCKDMKNTTRIGISKAKDLEWRFYAKEFVKE
ncbi:MAG: DNA-3-methyladenine glycosylase [Nanoarchaeota archaeon]